MSFLSSRNGFLKATRLLVVCQFLCKTPADVTLGQLEIFIWGTRFYLRNVNSLKDINKEKIRDGTKEA